MEYSNNELLDFKRVAVSLGLCGEYKKKWDGSVSPRELMDIALDANGVEFMADSFSFGWGMSKEYVIDRFADYINGGYVRNKDGYTSEMYVGYKGDIHIRSTITLIAWCDTNIIVPPHFVGRVYVCGNSNVSVTGDGRIDVYSYGDNDIIISSKYDVSVSCKRVDSSVWANGSGHV